MPAFDKTRSGVSLLIGIVIVAIITVFAVGISNIVISALRNTANVNHANEAYYAAEGALEQALLDNQNRGSGYSSPTSTPLAYCPVGEVCPTATWKIGGKAVKPASFNEFVIPTPSTGSAGKNCSPLVTISSDFTYVSGGTSLPGLAIDHPCNWNKIKVGETVAIPLYTTEYLTGPDEIVKNPYDMGLTSLKIKVRTPCKNGEEMCPATERFKLDDHNGDPAVQCNTSKGITTFCGDTIVSWQISGQNIMGDKIYTMMPNDGYDDSTYNRRNYNSEIYEWLINSAQGSSGPVFSGFTCGSQYCVVYAAPSPSMGRTGKDFMINNGTTFQSILEFLRNEGAYHTIRNVSGGKINKPVLKLSVVHSLNSKDNLGQIPYLEYQITTNGNLSSGAMPADTSQTITADGVSGTFKQVLEVKQPQESGILEYVIQQ